MAKNKFRKKLVSKVSYWIDRVESNKRLYAAGFIILIVASYQIFHAARSSASTPSLGAVAEDYERPDSLIHFLNTGSELKIAQKIRVAPGATELSLQDGSFTENVEFFSSPRCYIHMRDSQSTGNQPMILAPGTSLKVSKIDNVYKHGSGYLTYWFETSAPISHISCFTNYDHILSLNEFKKAVGNFVELELKN